jgi:tRNA G18 (ribose-2'-O)-methylase SpoU
VVDAAVDLIADGIENPHNVRALLAAARMFGAGCWFRHPKTNSVDPEFCVEQIASYDLAIALENLPSAESVFNFRLPRHAKRVAMVVGNERFGIRREVLAKCDRFVQIPMARGKVDTLNVAAAAAVGLRYLVEPPPRAAALGRIRRPQILFDSPRNAAEFGSALRSASAFGWREVFVNDANRIWFEGNRTNKAEARAAARRMKNDVRVLPACKLNGTQEAVIIDDIDDHLRLHATITLAEIARVLRTKN